MSTLSGAIDTITVRLARLGARLWSLTPLNERGRLVESALPVVRTVMLDFAPHREVIGWEDPLPVTISIVAWPETPRHVVGYLPALGVEIVARSEEELLARAPAYARMLLSRQNISRDLRIWARLARLAQVETGETTLDVEAVTAVESAKRAAKESETKPRSELKRAATDLRKIKLEPAFEIELLVRRIAEGLLATPVRPLLLVGPSGVGKTAAVHELVRQRETMGLGKQRFWQTDGSRLVAGMTGFGMWQQRCVNIIREAKRTEAILFLGNLVELMQVGRHVGNEQGIASFFKPYLLRGEFRAIAECTVEQRAMIEAEDPHLLSLFEELDVREPEKPRRLRILRAVAEQRKEEGSAAIEADALNRIDELHERFATYSAAPGRPLRFLTNLLRTSRSAVTDGDVTAAFAKETGLPLFMIDDAVPLNPDQAAAWFSQRVIGQTEAVRRVVDTLVVVKANLSRPARPIASLLFIGPTGVGKTQLAKSLAEYLFGDADRLTRFDMSEYGDAGAVTRLTRASAGGDGLLTAKVREQPFGVILFDEFEKAHASFFDILLQVLGEGRLTDGAGRLADFTNSVIIMTSNLGAHAFQSDGFGFGPRARNDRDQSHHFVEAVRDFLRPELFNRIDRTVPFSPLDRTVMRSIALREIERVRQRDGIALRNLSLNLDDAVIDHLVDKGFDAKLGARPLQRAIERQLLAPLADGINAYGRDTALQARAQLAGGALAVTVQAATNAGITQSTAVTASPLAGDLNKIVALRRQSQRLAGCTAMLELRNEAERLRRHLRLLKWLQKDVWSDPAARQLPRLEELLQRVDDTIALLTTAEDDLASSLYSDTARPADSQARVTLVEHTWRTVMLDIYCRRYASSDELLLGVYSDQPPLMNNLIECYRTTCDEQGATLEFAPLFMWTCGEQNQPREGAAMRLFADVLPSDAPTEFLHGRRYLWRGEMSELRAPLHGLPRAHTFGILLRARGPHITALLAGEAGKHQFRTKGDPQAVLVDASAGSLRKYRPPPAIEMSFADVVEPAPVRRSYDARSSTVDDKVLDRRTGWSLDHAVFALPRLIADAREKLLETMLNE